MTAARVGFPLIAPRVLILDSVRDLTLTLICDGCPCWISSHSSMRVKLNSVGRPNFKVANLWNLKNIAINNFAWIKYMEDPLISLQHGLKIHGRSFNLSPNNLEFFFSQSSNILNPSKIRLPQSCQRSSSFSMKNIYVCILEHSGMWRKWYVWFNLSLSQIRIFAA